MREDYQGETKGPSHKSICDWSLHAAQSKEPPMSRGHYVFSCDSAETSSKAGLCGGARRLQRRTTKSPSRSYARANGRVEMDRVRQTLIFLWRSCECLTFTPSTSFAPKRRTTNAIYIACTDNGLTARSEFTFGGRSVSAKFKGIKHKGVVQNRVTINTFARSWLCRRAKASGPIRGAVHSANKQIP